jgi:hypothetical protein
VVNEVVTETLARNVNMLIVSSILFKGTIPLEHFSNIFQVIGLLPGPLVRTKKSSLFSVEKKKMLNIFSLEAVNLNTLKMKILKELACLMKETVS